MENLNLDNKKKFIYEFRLLVIRFIIMGILGYAIEILATTVNAVRIQGIENFFTIEGHSHIGAFFLFGSASVLYTLYYDFFKRKKTGLIEKIRLIFNAPYIGVVLRCCIYALTFMVIEGSIGLLLWHVMGCLPGDCLWDYTSYWGTILGVTSFSMFPYWFLGGFVGEEVHKRLLEIDDILLNYRENVKEERNSYFEEKVNQRSIRSSDRATGTASSEKS